MDIDKVKERIQELEVMQEQSALNHHIIVGRISELKFLLEKLEKEEKDKKEIVEHEK